VRFGRAKRPLLLALDAKAVAGVEFAAGLRLDCSVHGDSTFPNQVFGLAAAARQSSSLHSLRERDVVATKS
jgi:hypothetical protein